MSLLIKTLSDLKESIALMESRPDFCIFAEEAGALNNTSYEWSFGNGDDSQMGFGIVLPFNCSLLAITLSTRQGEATVEARKNNSSTGLQVTSNDTVRNSVSIATDPISFAAGDVLGFRTVSALDASHGGKITAWFKWSFE